MEPVFEIVNESVNQEYKVTSDDAICTGNISSQQSEVKQITGTVYTKNAEGGQGEYIGNFTGQNRGGEMKYSFSEMNHLQSMVVWEVIDTIEANILNNEAAE